MTNKYLLTDEQYERLPLLLKRTCRIAENIHERDILLFGAITVMSGCLPKVQGIYDGSITNTNLFSLIIAKAGSGKGFMKYCKRLVKQYEERKKSEALIDGKTSYLFLPGNSSAASLVQNLATNNGEGIIFETEADSLSAALEQEWGNFSDLLRKAYHGESYQVGRLSGSYDIANPYLAILLSGTQDQLRAIINSWYNGLFSRFLFYTFSTEPKFRHVFRKVETTYEDAFDKLSGEYMNVITFNAEHPFCLEMSEAQGELFTLHFQAFLDQIKEVSPHLEASVKRLGLSIYRILMILTAFQRYEATDDSDKCQCSESLFDLGLALADAFFHQMVQIAPSIENRCPALAGDELFYSKLPDKIVTTAEAEGIAENIGISKKTASNYLAALHLKGKLEKPSAGKWRKT